MGASGVRHVTITQDYKEGDIDLQWEADCGFGHLAFKLMPDGTIHCNNEAMGREFVKNVLNKLVDTAVMEHERA